jgi:hypothetical protein
MISPINNNLQVSPIKIDLEVDETADEEILL